MMCWENKRQEEYFVDALDRMIIDLFKIVERVFEKNGHSLSPMVL